VFIIKLTLTVPFCFRVVADNPDQRIELKMFHSEFVQDLGTGKTGTFCVSAGSGQ
jgi:hypothetical protein